MKIASSPRLQPTLPTPGRDHILGPEGAPIQLLEYGDYECPFCRESHDVVKALIDRLGDKLCFAYRHFPLTNVHPHAEPAAEAAEAAAAQGDFWRMHDFLFDNQEALDYDDLAEYAAEIGLDAPRLVNDVMAGVYHDRVREDFRTGSRAGVNGTPTFFINGRRYDGDRGLQSLLLAMTESAP